MAVIVEVITPAAPISDEITGQVTAIDIVRTADTPINTVGGEAVVEVVGPGRVANAVVSATPPADPYEGQIWIDVS